MKFVDLQSQYRKIERNIHARINKVLEHGHYILGPEVSELEEKLSTFVGARYCITCASGTDALQMSLMSLGIGYGDEVITTDFSFFATAEAIFLTGATPIFVDIKPDTFNIDPSLIESRITDKTKAIIPVSLFGQCCDMDPINNIGREYQIAIIEDAAQSFGATYKGKKSCNLSTIGCTSFFPAKPLGCYGDGGACFTSNEQIASRMDSIRSHGKGEDKYDNVRIGLNSRLDTIQAAVLLEKLDIFPNEIEARQNIANTYNRLFNGQITTPFVQEHNRSAWAQYCLLADNRDSYIEKLKARNIPTNIYYHKPLSKQSAVRDKITFSNSPPSNSEDVASTIFSIPMHPYLSDDDQNEIAEVILNS